MLSVGIDVGTSGVRCAAINQQGDVICTTSVVMPSPIVSWDRPAQDPQIWWDAATQCLRDLTCELNQTDYSSVDIGALAVDGTSGTMVLVDSDLTPLSPGLMYNSAGFNEHAEFVREVAPPISIVQGNASGLARLMFMLQACGSAGIVGVLHQADWIAARLRGEERLSDETNSLKTGYDPIEGRWPSWIESLVPVDVLPQVVPAGSGFGIVCKDAAAMTGLPEGVRLVAGVTDSNAAFLASGASRPGDGVTSLGSTLAIKLLSSQPISDPTRGIYSHKIGDMWLPGGASNTGGAVLRKYFSDDQLQSLSRQLQPEIETGLAYYPLVGPGERFPISDSTLPARLSPRPTDDAQFLQGMLEGMAKIERAGYDSLTDLGAPTLQRVFSAGGGAANSGWTAIRKRALECEMMEAASAEAAVGTARLAAGLVPASHSTS